MTPKLKQKISELENKRTSLLDKVEKLDEAKLNARPIEGKWSVLEIIEHLVIAEREVMGGIREFESVRARERGIKNKIMYRVVMFVLKMGIPVKAPSKKMLPVNELSLEEIQRQWDENQKWFREYVESLDEEGLQKAVFKHPVSGPINVEQAVEMNLAHIGAHTRQIRKRLDLME